MSANFRQQSIAEVRATSARAGSTSPVEYDIVIRGQRIMTTAGVVPREVGVRDGRIVAIEPLGNALLGTEVIELASDEVLLPGLPPAA